MGYHNVGRKEKVTILHHLYYFARRLGQVHQHCIPTRFTMTQAALTFSQKKMAVEEDDE